MVRRETVEKIKKCDLGSRVLYGNDFPIKHWREYKPDYDPTEKELSDFFNKNRKKMIFFRIFLYIMYVEK